MRSKSLRALLVCAALAAVSIATDTLRAASSTVVISEFRTRGPNGAADEFVELYNASASAVDISGWKINGSNNAAGVSTRVTVPASTTLNPGCFFLATNSSASGGPYSGAVAGNTTFTTGITDDGGIALLTSANVIVDQVGMSSGSAYKEGTVLAPLTTTGVARSYERKPGGTAGDGTDTDNNAADFQLLQSSNPQNLSSTCITNTSATNPSGTITAAPSSLNIGDAITVTVTVTPGANPVSTALSVTGNLSAIGLGTPPFTAQPGNVFTFTGTVPAGVTGGAKSISATITDGQSRTGTTPSVSVTIQSPISPAATGSANPAAVPAGGTTQLTVNVTPGANPVSTGISVAADLSSIGGSGTQAFQGSGNIFTFAAVVDAATSPGPKTLPVTVSDAQGRTATTSIALNVPALANSTVVISQLYGGGGNTGSTYQNDYVQLYNRGQATVDLAGWTIQYASATGTSWANKQPLGGLIAPGEYYLVALASGSVTGAAALPPANITGEINMSATNGKLALVDNGDTLAVDKCPTGAHVRDFVGYGTANCSEGTATAPPASNTSAIFRQGGGFIDTDDNAADFVAGAPAPLVTAPIMEIGPAVLSTDPVAGATTAPRDATIDVTFTEPVDVSGFWYDITCATTGAHNGATTAVSNNGKDHYITPNVNFLAGETCAVTIFKDQVSDSDTDDAAPNTDHLPANYTWSFTVATGAAPPYTPDVHLAMGNPSGAVADINQPGNYLMSKPEYALSYNRDLGRPNWVSWHLTPDWFGTLARVDTFRPDPQVPPDWYRVQSFDFQFSGFDRGHMTPNADRDLETSIPINQATYLMSNMVAQAPDNNQGPWAQLEGFLRTLVGTRAAPTNEIYVVSGPAGAGGTGSNGTFTTVADGHVTVPAYTWKVALVLPAALGDDASRVTCATRTIAVIMPNVQGIRNDANANEWMKYLTTVDAVETLTGYDFFANVPQTTQTCIQAGINGNNPQSQVITFDQPVARTYGEGDFPVAAAASSGLPVTIAVVSGPATIAGGIVHLTGAGTVTLRATQNGNVDLAHPETVKDSYAGAVPVDRSFLVGKGTPVFSALDTPTAEAGASAPSVSGTLALSGLVPTGSVAVTLNGVTVNAAIGADGRFTATFPAAAFGVAASPYAIAFVYDGDANFTAATGASTLTVVDTTAPSVGTMSATPNLVTVPNHKMFDVLVAYTASDVSGAPVCALTVTSNEAINGTGDGDTAPDWLIVDAHHLQLRAERAGTGSGRLYTIRATCTDAFGNATATTTSVAVPK